MLQTRFVVTTVAVWVCPMCAMGRTTVEMTQMKGSVQVSTSSITVNIVKQLVLNTSVAFHIMVQMFSCCFLFILCQ